MTDPIKNGALAAAVIVRKGPRILAFIREKDGQVGLPCGWREDGELLRETAVRECLEETGYTIQIDSEQKPFIGFDPRGKIVVACFLGTLGQEGEPTHSHEGTPLWVGVRELLDSGYGDYNARALRNFGIHRPIAGKFHSHLTLKASRAEAERARALVGGKVTIIELERAERQQVDVMLTHHFVVGNRGLDDHVDVINSLRSKARQLNDSGIEVVRVKLEHELLDPRSAMADRQASLAMSSYIETHIKCKVDPESLVELKEKAAALGWHPSRNPWQQSDTVITQFVNRRFYDLQGKPLSVFEDRADHMVEVLSNYCQVAEVKIETAIVDSNANLDRWWAE